MRALSILSRLIVTLLAVVLCLPVQHARADPCKAETFGTMPLPANPRDPVAAALELAYPGLKVSADGTSYSIDGGRSLPMGGITDASPAERLRGPTVREQFLYPYPTGFDLDARAQPYFDPGRLRNDTFFRALYFNDKASTRARLRSVSEPGLTPTPFQMTDRFNIDCQLGAALSDLARSHPDYVRFFTSPGGSFNWRTISGTNRLSAHSFGIAFDINTKFGPYWKWSGARPGRVGPYRNEVPEDLVATMEKFGFIWGGKWHHYDAMHFEYRPELILYSRMTGA